MPTSDIYMYQVGLREVWLDFLKRYVRPLQESVYPGYYQNVGFVDIKEFRYVML